MSDDEIDFSQAAPATDAQRVVEFFKSEEMPTFGPEDVDALAETPLAYKEICEPLLKELHTVTERRKRIIDYEKELKEEFTRLVGAERGMVQRGAYGAKVLDTKGRKSTNWARVIISIKLWVCEQIAKDPKEAEAVKAEIDRIVMANEDPTSGPGIAITPYRVGSGDQEVE
jgi:hypothetical protein